MLKKVRTFALSKLQQNKDIMNIGELIKSVCEEQGISANELADKIYCKRQNVYKIFEKPSIPTAQLGLISKALKYDFFDAISKNIKLSGVDNPEAIREISNRTAVSQFVEVMPRILKKLGKEPTICFGGALAFPDDTALPDYCLGGGYDIEFSVDSFLSEKPNCNFENAIKITRVHCDKINTDIEIWQFKNSQLCMFNIKLDYKTEKEWEKLMRYVFDYYEKLI